MAVAIPFVLAAVAAVGAMKSAQAQSQSADAAANAANYNALSDQQRSTVALAQGNANEESQRRGAALALGRQNASMAQSGVDLSSGSALDLYKQSATNAELDALNIRYGSQLQAQGFKSQSTLDAMQADQQRRNASTAMQAGYLNAGAAALSSYGSYSTRSAQLDFYKSRPMGTLATG